MDKRCTVCNHSQTHNINLALLAGTTLDLLKQQFGLSRSALHRHKQHLQKTIDMAEGRMRNNVLLSYLFQLNDYNAAAAATVAAAQTEGNFRLTLQAVNAGARLINSMARFEVDLDHETNYRLMTSLDYVQSGCLLPGDPQIVTGPRQTLARSLAAACPETSTEALLDQEDLEEYLKRAQEPDANTPQTRQMEFPGFLIPLADLLPAAASAPRSTTGNQQPEPKRDRSGTEAGQTSPLSEIIEEIQRNMQEEKISGKDPAACPIMAAPPEVAAASAPELDDESTSEEADILAADYASPETLDEAVAAYLRDFPSYAKPTQDPKSASSPAAPSAPVPANPPPAPRSGLRPEPPNFGNPGLSRQLIGTFI